MSCGRQLYYLSIEGLGLLLKNIELGGVTHFLKDGAEFDVRAFEDALALLLRLQFVDPQNGDLLYQVICDSGMGSDHSSFLSSINFFHFVEQGLLCEGRGSSRASGIQMYTRYHDDMLVAIDSPRNAKDLLAKLKVKSKDYYIVSLEDVSTVGVAMLDLFVFKSKDISLTCRMSFRPHIKASARHVPLSSESHHHRHVHLSWPISEVRRMHTLSNNDEETFQLFKDFKISRFQQFGMPASILSKCKSWSPPSSRCESTKHIICSMPSKSRRVPLRVIIPYHRTLAMNFPGAMHKAFDSIKLMLKNVWPGVISLHPELAWSSHDRNLGLLLRT